MKARSIALATALAFSGACSEGVVDSPECGLLTPAPDLDRDAVPPEFLLEGVVITRVKVTKDRVSIALNNPRSVVDSFGPLKRAAQEAGFQIVGEDNEGFEAEIYLKAGHKLGQVQVRSSLCPDATVVFLNIVQT